MTVVGEGAERARLESLAAELQLRSVHFAGRAPHAKMPELYEASDIYLNSPDIDNMPLSIIEAYASGTAVVTTDAGGIPYLVQDEVTGLLVSRGDYLAMARAALRLLREPGLAERLTSRALEECQRYSWEAARENWLSLYHELAGV